MTSRGVSDLRLRLLLGLVALCCLATVGWVQAHLPLNGEDYAFARPFEVWQWGARFDWIVFKIGVQFSDWNARFGEQLAIIWLNMPSVVFWLLALGAFVALNLVMAALPEPGPGTRGSASRDAFWVRLGWSLGLLFLLWPGFELFFWKTIIAGYLTPMVLCLLTILPFTTAGRLRNMTSSGRRLTAGAVVAFLAGWSFENVPVALVVYMLVSWLLLPDRFRQWRALLPLGALLAGWTMLMLVPSTMHRIHYYREIFGITTTGPAYYLDRAGQVTATFFDTAWPLFLFAVMALIGLVLLHRTGRMRRDVRFWLLMLPALLTVGSVASAPYTEPRSFMFAWVIMFAFVIEGARLAWHYRPSLRWLLVLGLCGALFTQGVVLGTYQRVDEIFDKRIAYIQSPANQAVCSNATEQRLAIAPIEVDIPYRLFNNRDGWVTGNLDAIGTYYGCQLRLAEEGSGSG
ncbi:DUF6056 family protein [Kushneria aurantia]|uniref:DUF6056 family protein n=1 Tax=Kushneria aurantia TaxID=504092 RepID=A0ABV6G0P4_9GAMM|nr:DUF6056 family protein [Kushneria aurantia]